MSEVLATPTATAKAPTCPKCGSDDIAEFDVVPVRYRVTSIDADGDRTISDTGGEVVWDGGEFDTLHCCACDYNSGNPSEFYKAGEAI